MGIKFRKKTLISLAVALFMIISLMPGNVLKVLADGEVELTQADFEEAYASPGVKTAKGIKYVIDEIEPAKSQYVLDDEGAYKLTGNLDLPTIGGPGTLFAAEDVIIDLNGKELKGTLAFGADSVSTITGNGTVAGAEHGYEIISVLVRDKADVTIENGTFEQKIDVSTEEAADNPKLTINDGTFKSSIFVSSWSTDSHGTLTVQDGTFGYENAGGCANIYLGINAKAVINGGVFTSEDAGVCCEAENCELTINDGSFTGNNGLSLSGGTVTISKGIFKSNNEGYAITIFNTSDTSAFNDILAEGSSYDPELQAKVITPEATEWDPDPASSVVSQKEISVVKSVTKHTVTFYDGETKLGEVAVDDGAKVSKPASNPTKGGYTFEKWCSDSALTTAFDFDSAITADTSIYAKWTKNEDPTEPTDPTNPTDPTEPTPATGTLNKVGIYCAQDNPSIIAAFLTEKSVETDTVEYRWLACEESNPTAWFVVSDWTKDNYYLSWTPEKSGDYIIVAQARLVGNEEKTLVDDAFGVNFRKVKAKIKDICQMPYEDGYLIGIESDVNPNQSIRYEMLVMDLTLFAAGNPNCWVHSVKGQVAEGNALWTIWKPQYGYYITLFRIYDADDNLLDQTAYGFVNAY